MELSKYQKEIDRVYTTTNQNIFIEAGPGSGKTFMLCHLAKRTPITKKSIFLAFNKSIATELEQKLPANIKAMTIHSLGMRTLMKYYGFPFTVNESKIFILSKKIDSLDFGEKRTKEAINGYIGTLCKLVDLYRMNLLPSFDELIELALDYDLIVSDREVANVEKIMNYLNNYNKKLNSKSMIDFADMLWLCKDIPRDSFFQYDVVMVDETQDLNPLQKYLIDKIIKSTGRFICVGDSKQSIYSFMGSNLSSFNEFKGRPNTVTLPLSISYRCSKSIVEKANEIFEGLEYSESAVPGIVRQGKIHEIEEGDFVVCRNNFPLVELYIKLLSICKKATIYGKDYGEQLVKMLEDFDLDCEDKYSILKLLDEKRQELLDKIKDSGHPAPNMHPKITKFDEMFAIIKLLFEIVDSVDETIVWLKEMFTNDTKGIILMTCHKAKGLENDRVFFYRSELIPSPYATSQQMLYAEKCLYYVAVTRAKNELIFI